MADGDLFGGIQLDPLTEPPGNLDHAVIEHSIEKVRDWFFQNFESPDHHTPRDSGDFVYIWGGPWETREIIESVFDSPDYPPEVLEAAIEDIENDGDAWVPNERRIQPPEDYEDDLENRPARTSRVIHEQLVKRIGELEAQLAEVLNRPGLGHNMPPEAIDFDDGFDSEIKNLDSALRAIKSLPPEAPDAAQGTIESAGRTIHDVEGKWRERLKRLGTDLASGAAREAGKHALDNILDGTWLQWAVIHLHMIGSLVSEWAVSLFPPF